MKYLQYNQRAVLVFSNVRSLRQKLVKTDYIAWPVASYRKLVSHRTAEKRNKRSPETTQSGPSNSNVERERVHQVVKLSLT